MSPSEPLPPDEPRPTPPRPLEPATLPALHGWLWVVHGFTLFRPYAILWILLIFIYWMALGLASALPLIGPPLAMVLIPGIGAGWMVACAAVQQGKPPSLRHLIEPFRQQRNGQLLLGVVYLVSLALVLGLTALADGGLLFRMMMVGIKRSELMAAAPQFLTGGLIFTLLGMPILLGFWFAPALLHWQGMAPAKGLFFSLFACLRNWRPFLVYGLGWLLVIFILPALFLTALRLVLTPDLRAATLISFIMLPYMLAVVGALLCSFYSTYAAIFGPPPAPA